MPVIRPSRHFIGSEFTPLEEEIYGDGKMTSKLSHVLGSIDWLSDTEGFCECPGRHLHTSPDGRKDCKVFVQPIVTLSCFHGSCRIIVEETTKRLRRLALDGSKREPLTKEQKAQIETMQARERLRRQTESVRPRLLREYPWPLAQMCNDSLVPVPDDPAEHWRVILELFNDDDVIWAGSIYGSGKPEHQRHFQTKTEWAKSATAPGQFTCASVFKGGSFARSNDNVARRAFLVVESDELDRDTIGSVFRWMREKLTINLRCIVDTAGKSLHGWFEFPSPERLDELRIVLPALGCDPKMFGASQPCRLPGAMREGKFQRLVYLGERGAQ